MNRDRCTPLYLFLSSPLYDNRTVKFPQILDSDRSPRLNATATRETTRIRRRKLWQRIKCRRGTFRCRTHHREYFIRASFAGNTNPRTIFSSLNIVARRHGRAYGLRSLFDLFNEGYLSFANSRLISHANIMYTVCLSLARFS